MNEFYDRLCSREYGLRLPTSHKDEVDRYVAHLSGRDVNAERIPFQRKVDFWAFSIVTALVRRLEPLSGPPSRWGTVFIYSKQGVMDNELCSLLAVVATAKMGIDSPDIDDPGKIIEISNRLAGAGCPVVLKELSRDALRTTPLDRSITLARTLLSEAQSGN